MDTSHLSQLSLTALFLVYLSGVATSLTPCIYPLIPIVAGYLGAQQGTLAQRALASFLYVLGLSLVYSFLGLLAVFTGTFFGEWTTSSPVYLIFGVLMLALGGSMMDFYNLRLPRFLQAGAAQQKSSLWASFFLGASSGLVASPCTAPVLAGLLLVISTQKNYISGGLYMFLFALGLNTTLLIIGFSTNVLTHLPKSGNWMSFVKKALGALVIISGVYFIYRAGQIS